MTGGEMRDQAMVGLKVREQGELIMIAGI